MIGTIAGWLIARNPAMTLAHAKRLAKVGLIAAAIVAAVGGVFDWYAGNRKEIHAFWWKIYMAWLIRTIDRPELLKRYPKIGLFFWHLMLARVGVKKHPEFDNGRG